MVTIIQRILDSAHKRPDSDVYKKEVRYMYYVFFEYAVFV